MAGPGEVAQALWSVFTERPVERADVDGGRFDRLMADYYDPAIELTVRLPAWIGRDTYTGHAGMREFYREWFEAFDRVAFEVHQIEVAGSRAASGAVQRGETQELAVEMLFGFVVEVREGRVLRAEIHPTPQSALARLSDPI